MPKLELFIAILKLVTALVDLVKTIFHLLSSWVS